MKILTKHFARGWVTGFFLTLAILFLILFGLQSIHLVRKLATLGLGLSEFALAAFWLAPGFLIVISPAALLIGFLNQSAKMKEQGAWRALQIIGQRKRRLLHMLVIGFITLTALLFLLAHIISPYAIARFTETIHERAFDSLEAALTPGQITSFADNAIATIGAKEGNTLSNVFFSFKESDTRINITAQSALFQTPILFQNGAIFLEKGEKSKRLSFRKLTLDKETLLANHQKERLLPSRMSSPSNELWGEISQCNTTKMTKACKADLAEFTKRIGQTLLPFFFLFFAYFAIGWPILKTAATSIAFSICLTAVYHFLERLGANLAIGSDKAFFVVSYGLLPVFVMSALILLLAGHESMRGRKK